MKKILYFLTMLPVLAFLGACTEKEEIVFDHEQPAFDIRDNAILIEAIMPQGTVAEDIIYIAGAFNGGDAAVGNPQWQMEHSTIIPEKWGIYLDPSTFVEGTSLADGFWFVSEEEGTEKNVFGEPALHTLDAGVGTRNNVYVDRWASYFEVPTEEPVYRIWIQDNTGWDAVALYAWGDAEIFGVWPGATPTGHLTLGDVSWYYWDIPEESIGQSVHLIVNNNNGGSQIDNVGNADGFAMDGEYFFSATWADAAGSWAEASDPRDRGTYTIYVQNNTTWETALNCYAWADGLSDTDILGAWPGSEGVGTLVVGETTYYIYDVAETLEGATLNLIINNNGTNTQIPDYQYTVDVDCWFAVDDTSASEIEPLF